MGPKDNPFGGATGSARQPAPESTTEGNVFEVPGLSGGDPAQAAAVMGTMMELLLQKGGLAERREDRGEDAGQREVDGAGDAERPPAPLRAGVAGHGVRGADERQFLVGPRHRPQRAGHRAERPGRHVGIGREPDHRQFSRLDEQGQRKRMRPGYRRSHRLLG